MRKFYFAVTLCVALLLFEAAVLLPSANAKTDIVVQLLDLPAPPPPNPLARFAGNRRSDDFFNKSDPPKDNAPIADLLEYWQMQSSRYRVLGYNPKPSDRSLDRLLAEIQKDPKLLDKYLNIFPDNARTAEFVKELYDRNSGPDGYEKYQAASIKEWLTFHSPYYSSELARSAQQAGEVGEYAGKINELIALTSVDYEKAAPIIDRLYHDGGHRVSQVLAKWARYKRALDTDSLSDIERYRDELKSVVEDKGATAGMRDLAFDALVKEKDWSGRDEWYYSLLSDETLADLRVNGSSYTGLTTIISYSPDEKYIEKMIELVGSSNPVVRAAAARNLAMKIETGNKDIIKALIPWLEDPKWAKDTGFSRAALVRQLSNLEVPESVPGLIMVLDEKEKREVVRYASNSVSNRPASNAAATAEKSLSNSMRLMANRPANTVYATDTVESYPFRYSAVRALARQKDARAIPALRRILPQGESYESISVVGALYSCGGFSISEQMEALEAAAKGIRSSMDDEESESAAAERAVNAVTIETRSDQLSAAAYAMANTAVGRPRRPPTAAEISVLLASQIMASSEISDELAKALVDRIELLDTKDPRLAVSFRRMILKWQHSLIDSLILRDLKRDRADSDAVVRLLGSRKVLRERQINEIIDLQNGTPTAAGIGACLLEGPDDYTAVLESENRGAKTAMFACARLIRASLPVPRVAEYVKSPDRRLAMAAERYLESEDSPDARAVVLSLHPNEAKILGATTAFFPSEKRDFDSPTLWMLFQSVDDNDTFYNGWSDDGAGDLIAIEEKLKDEIKKDTGLVGVYAWDKNYVRIYGDRVIFSWDEDDSRYRERPLNKDEFDSLKTYLLENNVDQLAPFVQCGGDYCLAQELLMLGRGGGRRVYMNGELPAFFVGLNKIFAELKLAPAKVKYVLSKEMPELELLLADDDMHVETVWKNGEDMRVGVSDRNLRKRVKGEIEKAVEKAEEGDIAGKIESTYELRSQMRDKRQFEGFSWRKVVDGADAGPALQPPNVELIPIVDGLPVPATQEQWKARTPEFEVRGGDDGLFKVTRGKAIKLQAGYFNSPVITPNGKWVVVHRAGSDGDEGLVRVNLLTNKAYPIAIAGYPTYFPYAFVPTLNKILIAGQYEMGEEYYQDPDEDDTVGDDPAPEIMQLLDAESGALQPIRGEFRPLTQQQFRPLQSTSKANEFWAAIPDSESNETLIGVFDTRNFGFRMVKRIPTLTFNSMSMWVDEPGNKVYFVYRGHLLALPLKSGGQ